MSTRQITGAILVSVAVSITGPPVPIMWREPLLFILTLTGLLLMLWERK